jgi:hypothetical protein
MAPQSDEAGPQAAFINSFPIKKPPKRLKCWLSVLQFGILLFNVRLCLTHRVLGSIRAQINQPMDTNHDQI